LPTFTNPVANGKVAPKTAIPRIAIEAGEAGLLGPSATGADSPSRTF
jgi:hypothetical protein